MSIKYSKNAVIKGFVGIPDQFAVYGQEDKFVDAPMLTPQQRIDEIFTMSNNCRSEYQIPIFADESRFLPVSKTTPDVESLSIEVIPDALKAPNKKEDDTLINAVAIGLGIFVLYKILS